jgi:hypothetical protein
MKQYEAVIKVMEENGGFATLGYLYHEVLKVPGVEWKTKTPFASIRRIVQDGRFFFKIKPGLWALLSHKNKYYHRTYYHLILFLTKTRSFIITVTIKDYFYKLAS